MICQHCGKEFEKKWGKLKYCSPECYHAAHREYMKKYHKRKTIYTNKCICCGKVKCMGKHQICSYCKAREHYQNCSDMNHNCLYI